jgi:carboxylesterase
MRRRGEGIFSYPPQPGDLEPFRLGSGERGVLLIHGFCGTPPEMRGLGEHLAAHGFRVHGALLKGHGTTPDDLATTRWTDWVESAEAQLAELRKECAQVFVSGQSMGGALTLVLAARNPDVVGICTLSALVNLGRSTELQIRFGRRLLRWHYPDRNHVDLWDQQAVEQLRSYNRRPMSAHHELVLLYREALRAATQVRVPALILHGMRDSTVPPANARLIADAIGENASLRYFERSGHAITVDVDKEEAFALVSQHFLRAAETARRGRGGERVSPAPGSARTAV